MKPIVIIPTYNEAENIKKIVPLIFRTLDISILVVDDNSPDGTANVVETLQKDFPKLYLLKRDSKKGLASAYIAGFKHAIETGFDVFVEMDADFQHPYEILPEMIKNIEDYDVVIGSRYIDKGIWAKDNITKKIISKFGNIYSQFVLNCNIKDLTGGFNIWTKKALSVIDIDKIIAKGYMFQIEMKYRAFKNGLKITEFPIVFNQRRNGYSKMDFRICIEALIDIWKIR